jgi:hypothetical protein
MSYVTARGHRRQNLVQDDCARHHGLDTLERTVTSSIALIRALRKFLIPFMKWKT